MLAAISKNMSIYSLTEHMPRDMIDLYPEEACVPDDTPACVRITNVLSWDSQEQSRSHGILT